jgi:CRP-like cAMP-binding protein
MALRDLAPFAGCSDRELARADQLMTRLRVPAGRVLCLEGTAGRECFIVADGEVQVTQAGRDLGNLRAGAWVGELAVLDRRLRTATATTLVDTTVLVLDPREFHAMRAELPGVAAHLGAVVAERRRYNARGEIALGDIVARPA